MLNIPEKYNGLKFISPISWERIFDEWRKSEENQKSWQEHWEERGYASWTEWRKAYAAPLQPETKEWFLYEIENPIEITSEFCGVPSRGWIKKAYSGENTKKLKDIANLPIVSESDKIKEIMNNFPKSTLLTAILHKGEIILVEGMHRANALANWNLSERPQSKVLLALAEWNREDVPIFGKGENKKDSKISDSFTDILGVRIDNLSRKEILEKIESFLNDGNFHQIATVNPEFILQAQKDEEFKKILDKSDLNVADGVGIWFAFLRFGKYLRARWAGADLMQEILRLADGKKLSVFLAINKNGLSSYEEIVAVLSKKYPNLEIEGENIDPANGEDYKLTAKSYKLVLCNFGAPNQEKFINSLKLLENVKIRVVMGVGGSFDFLTGKVRRAPKIMRILGLEWFWRLIQKSPDRSRRWKRIWNAVVIFPIKVILNNNH